jgi:hypothetical protein
MLAENAVSENWMSLGSINKSMPQSAGSGQQKTQPPEWETAFLLLFISEGYSPTEP